MELLRSWSARTTVLLLVGAAGCSDPAPPPPDHVLLIVIDTQRADHLSCYGYPRPTSPAIDALAAEGVRFEKCVAQCSWTSPSMVSMMTSRYLGSELLAIPPEETALAEVFHAAGFATGAFICNNLLSPKHGFDRGFDVCEWELHPYGSNQPILEWIEGHQGRKTFTFVHLTEPHDEAEDGVLGYGPQPREEKGRFRKQAGALSPERLAFFDQVSERLHLVEKEASLRRIEAEIGGYDDDVAYVDARIREILERYKSLGLWGKTAVVIASDHGEGLFTRVQFPHGTRKTAMEHGEPPTLWNTLHMTHGSHVNWELVHVPLIVKAPGVAPGVAPGYVENIDILPTLLSLARLEVPKAAQGRSLLPWLADPKRTKGLAEVVTSLTRYNHSVITQAGLQLIHPTPRGECDFAILDEIYDLPRDPEARSNLVGSRREAVQRLGRLAEERARSGLLGATRSTDPKTDQALKKMGYVGGDVVDSVREEIAAMSIEDLVQGLAEEADCLLRYQRVRALEGRELSALERSALEAAAAQDGSEAVRAGIRALLGR